MIFTTVLVTCFCALLGVFHSQASVDTLLATLSHFNTPTVSSFTALLQITGSNMHLALDTAPLPKTVGSFDSPLPLTNAFSGVFASLKADPTFTATTFNLNTFFTPEVRETLDRAIPRVLPAVFTCAGLLIVAWVVYLSARDSCRREHTVAEMIISMQSHDISSNPDTLLAIILKDAHANGAFHHNTIDKDTVHYDPLAFICSPTSTREMSLMGSAVSPRYLPHSTRNNESGCRDASADDLHHDLPAFIRSPTSTLEMNTEDEEEEHLRFALDVPCSSTPSTHGWCSEDDEPTLRPQHCGLNTAALPSQDPDDLFLDQTPANQPLAPCVSPALSFYHLLSDDDEEDAGRSLTEDVDDPFLDTTPASWPLPPFVLPAVSLSSVFAEDNADIGCHPSLDIWHYRDEVRVRPQDSDEEELDGSEYSLNLSDSDQDDSDSGYAPSTDGRSDEDNSDSDAGEGDDLGSLAPCESIGYGMNALLLPPRPPDLRDPFLDSPAQSSTSLAASPSSSSSSLSSSSSSSSTSTVDVPALPTVPIFFIDEDAEDDNDQTHVFGVPLFARVPAFAQRDADEDELDEYLSAALNTRRIEDVTPAWGWWPPLSSEDEEYASHLEEIVLRTWAFPVVEETGIPS